MSKATQFGYWKFGIGAAAGLLYSFAPWAVRYVDVEMPQFAEAYNEWGLEVSRRVLAARDYEASSDRGIGPVTYINFSEIDSYSELTTSYDRDQIAELRQSLAETYGSLSPDFRVNFLVSQAEAERAFDVLHNYAKTYFE